MIKKNISRIITFNCIKNGVFDERRPQKRQKVTETFVGKQTKREKRQKIRQKAFGGK